MSPDTLARWEGRLRPLLVALPASWVVRLYSGSRRRFLERLAAERPAPYAPPPALARTLWGLRFRAPLGNAAGMFKNGAGYELAARQGAGFFLAGTSTARPRAGNRAHGVALPFAPYPRSGAASNWLGLPNPGDEAVAARLAAIQRAHRVEGCPVGASVAGCPELAGEERLTALVAGLEIYDAAGVDFLEINESCPNTGEAAPPESELRRRLERIAEGFLARRRRPLPVIVKFSVDTRPDQVPGLVDTLVEMGYDGVNFGNTSASPALHEAAIAPAERRLFRHFSGRFGGGLSGRPLKSASLELARAAVRHLGDAPGRREFHVIRTGGIEDAADLIASETAGIGLEGWYTGYFEAFARHGHRLYRALFEALASTGG